MTSAQAAAFLKQHDNYLILTHVRPDGDTVGCAAALCLSLRQLGKTAHVLSNPELHSLFAPYLEGLIAPDDYEPDTVVSTDIAARGLFPENAKVYLPRVDLAIDHHPSQEFFAAETCLDAGRAACGELVFEIVKQLGPVPAEIAIPLYVAISTDCGCFAYGNTTADTHRAAAELAALGAPLAQLNKIHFRTKSAKRLRLESTLISGMELYEDGAIAIVHTTLALMDSLQATERDAEDIASVAGQLEGVRVSVTIREMQGGRCKLSVRSDPSYVNAGFICAELGGGGHAAAAGASMDGTVDQTRDAVLTAIRKVRESS